MIYPPSIPEVRGLNNPGSPLPGVEVDAGVVPLTDQLLCDLGVVVMVSILGHVAPTTDHMK